MHHPESGHQIEVFYEFLQLESKLTSRQLFIIMLHFSRTAFLFTWEQQNVDIFKSKLLTYFQRGFWLKISCIACTLTPVYCWYACCENPTLYYFSIISPYKYHCLILFFKWKYNWSQKENDLRIQTSPKSFFVLSGGLTKGLSGMWNHKWYCNCPAVRNPGRLSIISSWSVLSSVSSRKALFSWENQGKEDLGWGWQEWWWERNCGCVLFVSVSVS